MSKTAKQHSLAVSTYTARWKEFAPRSEVAQWRAVCGKPKCPGSLGRLAQIIAADPDRVERSWTGIIESFMEQKACLEAMEQRTDVPEGIDPVKRRRFLVMMRERVDAMLTYAEVGRRDDVETARRTRNALTMTSDDIPEWGLVPDVPFHEPGTPRNRRPRPIYYGYQDSGYRISVGGKRTRDGHRVGRRPYIPRDDLPEWCRAMTPPQGPVDATGQFVTPPCRIWCPVCKSLNKVNAPPGFEVVEQPVRMG